MKVVLEALDVQTIPVCNRGIWHTVERQELMPYAQVFRRAGAKMLERTLTCRLCIQ